MLVVEYLFIVYWPEVCDFGPIRGCVLSTIINLLSNGLHTEVFAVHVHGFCDCQKLTFYVANI